MPRPAHPLDFLSILFVIVLTAICHPIPCAGDIIHFKDGMRTVCQGRAWEEKDEVRCEHQGAVLIYLKADVQSIEKRLPPEPLPESPPDASPPPPRPAATPTPAPTPPPAADSAPAAPPPRVAPKFPTGPPRPESGLMFYDPRRPKKYWSSETRHHDSFPEAIAALAAEYDRPPEWIERHLADTNDLVEVRRILEERRAAPDDPDAPPAATAEPPVDFYNPRRPQPYWTSESDRHATYEAAVQAFAKEFSETTQWVETHMGESNDLNEIRRNLSHVTSGDFYRPEPNAPPRRSSYTLETIESRAERISIPLGSNFRALVWGRPGHIGTEVLRRMQGPIGVPQQGPPQQHGIRPPTHQDLLGLLRIRNQPDRPGGDLRLFADSRRKGDLKSRSCRDFGIGQHPAAGAVDQVDSDLPQAPRKGDGLRQIPSVVHPVGGRDANEHGK